MLAVNHKVFCARFLYLTQFILLGTGFSQEPLPSLPESEILPNCIESITGNYAKLTTVRAKLYWVLADHTVDEEQTTKIAMKNGDEITITQLRRVSERVKFTSKGADFRHEKSDGNIFIVKGDTLLEVTDIKVLVRKLSESPGYGTLDPRELGGNGFRSGLLDQLKQSKLLSAKANADGTVDASTEINSRRTVYTFDRYRNWLPVRIIHYRDDRHISSYTEFEYQEVLPKVWFIQRATTNYAGSFKITEIKPDTKWSQTELVYTFGKPEINVPISDEELASTTVSKPTVELD